MEMCPKLNSSADFGEQDEVPDVSAEVCGEDIIPSCGISSKQSSGDTSSSSSKGGNIADELVAEHCINYPPTTSQSYYPGYDGTCFKLVDQSSVPSNEGLEGVQIENSSSMYYIPECETYALGKDTSSHAIAVNAQYMDHQPYLSSAGYIPQTVTYGSESASVCPCDSKQVERDTKIVRRNPADLMQNDSDARAVVPSKSEALNSMRHIPTSRSNFPCQANRPLSKSLLINTDIQPTRDAYRQHHLAKIPLLSKHDLCGLDRSRSIGQTINSNYHSRINEKANLHGSYEVRSDLVRGPRTNRVSFSSSTKKISSSSLINKGQYNRSDFKTTYEHAKFFMIKSYSEDDIHKSIKYNVWSSTINGNNKLDAAFRDAKMEMKQKGEHCPIFLFFSVNTSGQFVGLAEMIGPVDFKKTMDFWQQDKWTGFFPITWHVIKDIPNRQFQNIILENNDNRAVTFSRDTQEIGLPQGLRMLFIFKGYPMATSILDDFDFYEARENSLRTTRSSRHAVLRHSEAGSEDHSNSKNNLESSFRKMGISARPSAGPSSSVFNHRTGPMGPSLNNPSLNNRRQEYRS